MIGFNMYVAPPTTKGGTDGALTITAAGSTLATATALNSNLNVVTTAGASTGVSLPANAHPGEIVFVYNAGANALSVYPATATGTIAGGSAGAAVSLAVTNIKTRNAMFICVGTDTWMQYVSA